MDEESISLTTFTTPQGHYERMVIPFGLKNAPQVLQKEWITSSEILIIIV